MENEFLFVFCRTITFLFVFFLRKVPGTYWKSSTTAQLNDLIYSTVNWGIVRSKHFNSGHDFDVKTFGNRVYFFSFFHFSHRVWIILGNRILLMFFALRTIYIYYYTLSIFNKANASAETITKYNILKARVYLLVNKR